MSTVPETIDSNAASPTSFKKKLASLWGATTIDRGYTVSPTILIWGQGRLGIDNNELPVLMHIISHRWSEDSDPFISKETLAARMGRSQRTVQRYLTSLEEKKLINRVVRRKAHKGQDANGFDVSGLKKTLAELAPDFKKVSDLNKKRKAAVQTPPDDDKAEKGKSSKGKSA